MTLPPDPRPSGPHPSATLDLEAIARHTLARDRGDDPSRSPADTTRSHERRGRG